MEKQHYFVRNKVKEARGSIIFVVADLITVF